MSVGAEIGVGVGPGAEIFAVMTAPDAENSRSEKPLAVPSWKLEFGELVAEKVPSPS